MQKVRPWTSPVLGLLPINEPNSPTGQEQLYMTSLWSGEPSPRWLTLASGATTLPRWLCATYASSYCC